jgi:hypothetical protein
MHITCELPDVERTVSLRDMPEQSGAIITTLEELSTHAKTTHWRTTIRLSHHHAGFDGGSVNNDSWKDLQQAYPLLYWVSPLFLSIGHYISVTRHLRITCDTSILRDFISQSTRVTQEPILTTPNS